VVMALGGFNANREMLSNYITEAQSRFTPPARHIAPATASKMAIDVGADLWHMDGIEYSTNAFKAPDSPSAFWPATQRAELDSRQPRRAAFSR